MPAYFQEGDTPLASDSPKQSLQKVVSLLSKSLPGFSLPIYDTLVLSYYGTTNNIHNVTYYVGATVVAVLSLSYLGGTPTTDDATLSSVTRTA